MSAVNRHQGEFGILRKIAKNSTWNKIVSEKPIAALLFSKFPTFYGT
jgi:hypothetical protein